MTTTVSSLYLESFLHKVESRSLTTGIVGLGYVGLPLARLFTSQGFRVVGLDIDQNKTSKLMKGESYIGHIPDSAIRDMRADDGFIATSDFTSVQSVDTLSICVPTPLDKYRQPDLTAVRQTAESLTPHLRPGQLVILESTTYPGTTTEVVLPILQKSGLKIGEELFVGYSPEREDPANPHFTAKTIPKVVGANDAASRLALEAFYGATFDQIVPVSSCEAAEMSKILENIYRCVNIALMNELKLLCQRMGLNIWEIVDAAKTKPFGFQAFYPGPGLGGHCIPIDPFYLSWKAREYDFTTRFIELAGEINTNMPYEVVSTVAKHLNDRKTSTSSARLLVLGLAYKKNVDDCRESPAIKILRLLDDRGIQIEYFDPHVSGYVSHRYGHLPGKELKHLSDSALLGSTATLILTDHDAFDYERIVRLSNVVIDTRNATRNVVANREKILFA
ncbi:nucleotide sugar dehydrogenase [Telmatobacter sp. DSM 110680]|uniref:Nucleotide sugar dehydrogenase n=1 Tax=Telmatobacter sp. DSM 110680 TaxID=3036704 RepID=A0AAU7DIM5_9BACT